MHLEMISNHGLRSETDGRDQLTACLKQGLTPHVCATTLYPFSTKTLSLLGADVHEGHSSIPVRASASTFPHQLKGGVEGSIPIPARWAPQEAEPLKHSRGSKGLRYPQEATHHGDAE